MSSKSEKPKPKKAEEKVQAENPMRKIFIEKVLLSAGATGDNLLKAKKLLEILSSSKAQIIASTKRIPDFGISPGLEVGTRVTLRGDKATELLKRLLSAIDNKIKKKQVVENNFSFGVKEYIEIPGMEYQRDIGIRGFNVNVVFIRKGIRISLKKIKSSKIPKKQRVSKKEIIKFMEDNFKTEFI
ncbi:MAG: 50S ribosomal protein L5 [Nanoarchaeota archaeon]